MTTVEPTRQQVLDYCARDPVERVFLEDVARRGLGRFRAIENGGGELTALCHAGSNIVPSGVGTHEFAQLATSAPARMIIGEQQAVTGLWEAARSHLPEPREDRPGQPVFVIDEPPPSGETRLRAATLRDVDRLLPACAAAHQLELGVDPLAREPESFRWRTTAQIEEGRSWVWFENDRICFKAEASAWTPRAVQVAQVWVDPEVRGHGYARRGLSDLVRLLLGTTPTVTLFVRTDNPAAIGLYEKVGMRRALEYRSLLF